MRWLVLSAAGAAVSASFLFIVGLANSIILYRTLRARKVRALSLLCGRRAE
jgi:high-affinity nickel permease